MTVWKVFEEISDEGAARVKAWTLYLVKEGESPDQGAKPFAKGDWFFGEKDRDPAGHRFYIEAYLSAMKEVDRLNAQPPADG